MSAGRKLRVGMVGGGGPANFFGGPHRTAILMDNTAELTAGALRSSAQGSLESARELHFTRGYPDYETMVRDEAALGTDQRIDYVTIVTPNDSHYPVAKAFLEAGFPVLCEKPLTVTLEQSQDLVKLAHDRKLPFIVAYTYTGLPMVMLAREFVRNGDVGEVRKVEAWYPQGWLAGRTEDAGVQQAQWRVDPKKSGASGCGGDIGTHAYEFVRFVAGLTAVEVQARLHTFVPGRRLDDDFTVLARLNNGGLATITASQVTIGAQNDNGFRITGTKGTLEWSITDHNTLKLFKPGEPVALYRLGAEYGYFPESIKPYLRLPSGHPEGFHEALANLHKSLQLQIRKRNGEDVPGAYPHPDVVDGAAGMAFIEAAVQSSHDDGRWTKVTQVG
ncbi:MAG TPA: Gfo/Idh/MocA family oxidoreductase [Armatimonadota bacterium]|nr:Gfo/Idh/MocA family oxidoreductase [Armatimonadota bacterium]